MHQAGAMEHRAGRKSALVLTLLLLLCGEGRGGTAGGGVGEPAEADAFLAWAASRGVDYESRFEIAEKDGRGRGLIAVRAFVPGELLLATPNAVMFTPDTARRSRMGARFAEAGLKGCAKGDGTSSDCTALLVFHLLEEYHNASSDLAPWMRLFPRQLSSPLFWTEDEYEQLQGSNLYEICAGWAQSIKDTYSASIRALRAKFPEVFPKKGKRSIYRSLSLCLSLSLSLSLSPCMSMCVCIH